MSTTVPAPRRNIAAPDSKVRMAAEAAAPAVPETAPKAAEEMPGENPPAPPADPESPDYKAGWDAGYAKGFDDGKASVTPPATPAPEGEKPADATAPAAAKPATASELRALAPDDSGFCMDCLGEELTLAAATSKYAAKLAAELKAEKTHRASVERALATETASPAPARLAGAAGASAAPAADPADPKAAAAAEWDADPAVRVGFTKKENYVAWRSAEIAGRARMFGQPVPAPAK